ncbi:NEDD8-activating enzyme E1 regulatory subunit-like [Centruroides sculpturatus]|uniref:NEDD8-activating enzyme E1 regulatory subunit-like n=1 Tax=Centruroides sculpturatus TaxID=218467 RepID=UPI000C6DD60E|nr:NEDD8-activating enzyme E1 regulatory subunit-like [Centruroides sculpturatus]
MSMNGSILSGNTVKMEVGVMACCKPKSPDNEKSKKYDRQLRLWGDHGQTALEGAHICLVNATATGTEILKNIILPGIGAFTIVDGNKITGEDVGNNFFLDKESIGKSRAQVATQYLLELNSDVRGDCFEETPEELLEANSTFFNNFSVVIGTSLTEKTLLTLSEKLWEANIPFLVCRSYGMVGYMRLQVTEHTVTESHPDDTLYDLRLDNPFPSLQEHVESYDFENMNKKHQGCLNRLLQEWNHGPLGKDDYIHEMCRYGACELHSVASFIGGCAAQEVIKLVTGQYVPFNNTYIYNAMTATSSVFQL